MGQTSSRALRHQEDNLTGGHSLVGQIPLLYGHALRSSHPDRLDREAMELCDLSKEEVGGQLFPAEHLGPDHDRDRGTGAHDLVEAGEDRRHVLEVAAHHPKDPSCLLPPQIARQIGGEELVEGVELEGARSDPRRLQVGAELAFAKIAQLGSIVDESEAELQLVVGCVVVAVGIGR